MYDAIEDLYTYKNSTVLVNKLDLQSQDKLEAFEAEISSARAEEPLPDGLLDFVHYSAVHHHLFQDVYHWAGQVRTVRISKGGNPFCFPENIEGQANKLFTDLQSADHLRNLDAQTFADKAAHFLAELNQEDQVGRGVGHGQPRIGPGDQPSPGPDGQLQQAPGQGQPSRRSGFRLCSCHIRMATANRPVTPSLLSTQVAASCWPIATARPPGSPRRFQLCSPTPIGWPE